MNMRTLVTIGALLVSLTACGGGSGQKGPTVARESQLPLSAACQALVLGGDSSPVNQAVNYYAALAGNASLPRPTDAEVGALHASLARLSRVAPSPLDSDAGSLAASLSRVLSDGGAGEVEKVRAAALDVGRICADYLG